MFRIRLLRIGAVLVAAAAVVTRPAHGQAQAAAPGIEAQAQYDDWVATYGRWTPAQAEKAGYLPTDVCVTATAVGLPAETGAMGRHFVHPGHIEDGRADADAPDIVLFDAQDKVVGLEFEILTVVEPIPSVAGIPMERTPADPGVDQEHLSLHVYFVGETADRFATFNPAVDCGADVAAAPSGTPAGTSAEVPAALAVASEPAAASRPASTARVAASPTRVVTESVAVDADPGMMPVAGAGDWLPGGEPSLLGVVAGVLVLLAAAGWMTAARRA